MDATLERIKAYAIDFNKIQVFLSSGYYNGVSNKFYLRSRKDSTMIALHGDRLSKSSLEGFQEYRLTANFVLGEEYEIVDAYGLAGVLNFSKLALCKDFDEMFSYSGNDLGINYTKKGTRFKLWAPTAVDVILKVMKNNGQIYFYSMKRERRGVYTCYVKDDLEGCKYLYLIKQGDIYVPCTDPYALSSSSNGTASIVVDEEKIKIDKIELPIFKKNTDAIIYETSVRDFSSFAPDKFKYSKKFLAFTEEGLKTDSGEKIGIDYLEDLGITHIQLMPFNDFASVDEENIDELYNWGYDPAQYSVTEGSYVTDANDGYKRITEAQDMIKALHKKGIRVIMDVVFNHMHDVNNNPLERSVPYYFFRRWDTGFLSNGSWCGNDLNTTAKMCRKYILDICKRWQILYGVDGFRFDLMGIIDVETINQVYSQGKEIDDSFILYGEGWNMDTALPYENRATIINQVKTPNVGYFNDYIRDTLRGANEIGKSGYISGDTYKTNDAMVAICDLNKFSNINQSINYTECHDNITCYDKLKLSNHNEDDETICKRLKLMLGTTLLAIGVPFIHSGQEFYRTKNWQENSYNAGDNINALDWNRKDKYIENVNFIKFLINLRKQNECFRYNEKDIIKQNVKLENVHHRIIKYSLHQNNGKYSDFIIYINPSLDDITITVDDGFDLMIHTEGSVIYNQNQLCINKVSMAILSKKL